MKIRQPPALMKAGALAPARVAATYGGSGAEFKSVSVRADSLQPQRSQPVRRWAGYRAYPREFRAEPSSLAVMSTMGMTRSYAMRVGPMTPRTPTISLSRVYGAMTMLQSSRMV